MKTRYTRIIIAIMTVLVLISAVSFVFADEPQNNWQQDTSNLCDAGNILDGKCTIENDAVMTAWMFEFGWWWQRVAEADITACDVPTIYGGYCGLPSESEQLVVIVPAGVTYIIVLQGSTFAGIADYIITSDNFDATTDLAALGLTLNTNDSLEIHGNANVNVIVGSSGDDTIYGYGGNDNISGGYGDDTIDGGDETGTGGLVGDTINGGNGNDTINGGNETCNSGGCDGTFTGDTISGGNGNDTINGGNESCGFTGYCAIGANVGDTINGDDGNDTINGGNESCGSYCDGFGTDTDLGDVISGGNGDDTINGGDETCGGVCVTGDVMNGDAGNDTIVGGTGTDTADGGLDTDSCDAETESNCE